MQKSTNNFLPALIIVALLSIPVICLGSALVNAPHNEAPKSADTMPWVTIAALVIIAGLIFVGLTGGERQPIVTHKPDVDALWLAAHTNLSTSIEMGEVTPAHKAVIGKVFTAGYPSPTPTNTPKKG